MSRIILHVTDADALELAAIWLAVKRSALATMAAWARGVP